MDNIIYILLVSVSIPILLMTFIVDKRSRFAVLFMAVGIFISAFASELNGLLLNRLPMDIYEITVVVTPLTEEILKAIPVLYYAIVISDKNEKLFTAAMAIGVGFAVLENAYYMLNYPNFNMMNAIVRAFGSGLMHAMCTLLVGVGISFVRKKRKLFVAGTFGLLATAIVYHGIYNILIQSEYDMIGAILPIVTYIPFLVWRLSLRKKETLSA